MASVIKLTIKYGREDILEHTNAKCRVCILLFDLQTIL